MGKTVCIFLALILVAQGARILGVFPLGAKSHHRFIQPVMKTLAEAGHKVVVYSPFPVNNPPTNYTDVYLENIAIVDKSKEVESLILEIMDYPNWRCLDLLWTYMEGLYRDYIGDKEIRALLSSTEKFDIIFVEVFCSQEFTLLLSHIFNAPVIGLQAFFTNNVVNSVMGNSLSLSYIPDTCSAFSNKMTFFERMYSSLSTVRGLYYHYNFYLPKVEIILRRSFPDMPPLLELSQNVSLMFVNDHLTADYAKPRTPNIIPLAGIHIESPKPLPKDIKTFMDAATDGVIFFSLGTYTPDELEPKVYFDKYNNVFKKLTNRVLWKTRKENIEDLPANVMTVKWAPQPDILAHPKCVLFITHGGLLSQHEAVHFGVPVISIPQFYDQYRNSKFYEEKEIGVMISSKNVSEETMTAAIRRVLGNPSYKENVEKLSQIFRDRPLSPAESVVFWTEYVLRHGGAGHLRPASTRLRWYQRYLLDVLAAVLIFISGLFVLLFVFIRRFCTVIRVNAATRIKNCD